MSDFTFPKLPLLSFPVHLQTWTSGSVSYLCQQQFHFSSYFVPRHWGYPQLLLTTHIQIPFGIYFFPNISVVTLLFTTCSAATVVRVPSRYRIVLYCIVTSKYESPASSFAPCSQSVPAPPLLKRCLFWLPALRTLWPPPCQPVLPSCWPLCCSRDTPVMCSLRTFAQGAFPSGKKIPLSDVYMICSLLPSSLC